MTVAARDTKARLEMLPRTRMTSTNSSARRQLIWQAQEAGCSCSGARLHVVRSSLSLAATLASLAFDAATAARAWILN